MFRVSIRTGGTMTFGKSLDGRNNALNLARLVLALAVVVSHTWPVGGAGLDPSVGGLSLGSYAVLGFFGISGYLITGSANRLSLADYCWKRILRIYPGLWVCLVVTAFGFALLAAWLRHVTFDPASAAFYVFANLSTFVVSAGVGPELDGTAFAHSWNGPLWSLFFEIFCYVLAALPYLSGVLRRHPIRWATGGLVASMLLEVGAHATGIDTHGGPPVRSVFIAFFAGALLWTVRDRVRVTWPLVTFAALTLVVTCATRSTELLAALPLTYLVLAFGAAVPLRWGVRTDLSYGVYIYAWPVQQLGTVLGVPRHGLLVYLGLVLGVVLPLAWLSWTLVEHPAQRLYSRRQHMDGGVAPMGRGAGLGTLANPKGSREPVAAAPPPLT